MSEKSKRIEQELRMPDEIGKRWSFGKRSLGDSTVLILNGSVVHSSHHFQVCIVQNYKIRFRTLLNCDVPRAPLCWHPRAAPPFHQFGCDSAIADPNNPVFFAVEANRHSSFF